MTNYFLFVLCFFLQKIGHDQTLQTELAYTVTNPYDFPVFIDGHYSPFSISGDFLNIFQNGERLPYEGMNTLLPADLEGIYLDSGESFTINFVADPYYNLESGGFYAISLSESPFFESLKTHVILETHLGVATGQQGKKGFSLWNKLFWWKKPRTAKLPATNTILIKKRPKYFSC